MHAVPFARQCAERLFRCRAIGRKFSLSERDTDDRRLFLMAIRAVLMAEMLVLRWGKDRVSVFGKQAETRRNFIPTPELHGSHSVEDNPHK